MPLSAELEALLNYRNTYGSSEKGSGMWLLGFVDRAKVPRHPFMKVGDGGRIVLCELLFQAKSLEAMSAGLVRPMLYPN